MMRQRRTPETQNTMKKPLIPNSGGSGDDSSPSSPSAASSADRRRGIRAFPEAVCDFVMRVIKSALSICKGGASKVSSPSPPVELTSAARERLNSLRQRAQVSFDGASVIHRRALGLLWELSFKEDTNKSVS